MYLVYLEVPPMPPNRLIIKQKSSPKTALKQYLFRFSNSNFLPHNLLLDFLTRSSSNSSSNLERGRSSTNSSGVQQQNKDSLEKPGIGGASIESSKGRGFSNILTLKSNNDEAGRSRIPSSRNYPSSPILPINSATNEEHNNPLTKNC